MLPARARSHHDSPRRTHQASRAPASSRRAWPSAWAEARSSCAEVVGSRATCSQAGPPGRPAAVREPDAQHRREATIPVDLEARSVRRHGADRCERLGVELGRPAQAGVHPGQVDGRPTGRCGDGPARARGQVDARLRGAHDLGTRRAARCGSRAPGGRQGAATRAAAGVGRPGCAARTRPARCARPRKTERRESRYGQRGTLQVWVTAPAASSTAR